MPGAVCLTMTTMPGLRLSKARPPAPRTGIDASEEGSVPVEPLEKPMLAEPPLFDRTTALSQSV